MIFTWFTLLPATAAGSLPSKVIPKSLVWLTMLLLMANLVLVLPLISTAMPLPSAEPEAATAGSPTVLPEMIPSIVPLVAVASVIMLNALLECRKNVEPLTLRRPTPPVLTPKSKPILLS